VCVFTLAKEGELSVGSFLQLATEFCGREIEGVCLLSNFGVRKSTDTGRGRGVVCVRVVCV
jgi:hypothetical protein